MGSPQNTASTIRLPTNNPARRSGGGHRDPQLNTAHHGRATTVTYPQTVKFVEFVCVRIHYAALKHQPVLWLLIVSLLLFSTVHREPLSGRKHQRTVVLSSHRLISTSQLHALLHFHIWPINPVVYWEPLGAKPHGNLILRRASRLDAFSGYHFRT